MFYSLSLLSPVRVVCRLVFILLSNVVKKQVSKVELNGKWQQDLGEARELDCRGHCV